MRAARDCAYGDFCLTSPIAPIVYFEVSPNVVIGPTFAIAETP
jgi:hypothetical protein